jgi:hypothetical protein
MADDISTPEVAVNLSGEIFTLKPTLGAAIGINAAFGGIYLAGQRAMQGDIAAIATIIRHGAALDAKAEAEIIGKVFRAGVTTVSTKAMEFIGVLMNGGKAAKDAEPGEANRDGPTIN